VPGLPDAQPKRKRRIHLSPLWTRRAGVIRVDSLVAFLCVSAFAAVASWTPLWAQAEPAPPLTPAELSDPGQASEEPSAPPPAPLPSGLPTDLMPLPPPSFAEASLLLTQRPGADPTTKTGIGIGLTLGIRWAMLWQQVELSTALDFAYAHHRKNAEGVRTLPNGMEETFDGERLSSENTFGALQILMIHLPYVRPWVGVGGGLGVGYFSSDEKDFRPGSTRAYRPYAQFAGGLAFVLWGQNYIDLRVDYHAMNTNPIFQTAAGVPKNVFGDLLTIGLAFGSRLP
jgi:hypothetical protein